MTDTAVFADTVSGKNTSENTGENASDIRKATDTAVPRLVRIETVGGHEKVGSEFANEGTAAGILLDKDGFVITSAFNFIHDPSSILIRFSDNTKKVAEVIATDRNRMLTLLKTEPPAPSSPLAAAITPPLNYRSKDSLKNGELCIVLGTALSLSEPNITVGIVSGKDRIWGKAVQTDAAIGPDNYGGAIIDKDGRFIAVAVPLSMTSNDIAAGADLYDAGVGMGIPFEDIFQIVLPRMMNLKGNKNLEPAYFGFNFKDNKVFIGEAVLDGVAAGSPAEKAGLKIGDKITAVNGQEIHSCIELTMFTRKCYAGEKIQFKYLRNGNETQTELETAVPPKK
ncbi:hypothetical protein FACS18942_10230 [Planctomycetales bacterium]|nr:hypothetical protein FACS18942_10230 [Planctomycetales bacterium]GHT38763.1 hypothetical protein FACS189427_13020 [Planctomycetales bacterium]